jgi:cell division protein FtsB
MASLLSRRRVFAVGVLILVGLLYYRPLHDYFAARAQRAERVVELRKVTREKAALERRLQEASSSAALAAQERLLNYIRPGDHLFIVKNIRQWRHRQDAQRRGHH